MGLQDLFFTPICILLFLGAAYLVRSKFTNYQTRKYFLPGLLIKMFGAIMLGLIFEFYYGYGGDTFNYYYEPGIVIANLFFEDPVVWFRLVFLPAEFQPDLYAYTSRIFTYQDSPTYFIARIVGFFGVFTFNSYYAIAVCFATLSFGGVWALFSAFQKLFPRLTQEIAITCLFFPSLWFWGSGILKDTITMAAMGWLVYAIFEITFHKKYHLLNFIILLISGYLIFVVKIYILMCLVPALIFLYGYSNFSRIKNRVIKILVFPAMLVIILAGGYYALLKIGEQNDRYALNRVGETAQTTARWLSYSSIRDDGSVYSLGDFDYSLAGMIAKGPLSIYTGLFRPMIWEVRNPVMLLSALETLFILFLLLQALVRSGFRLLLKKAGHPIIIFCLAFAVIFAFAVGISTYNFGSLVRYRIPMIPFLVIAIYLIRSNTWRPGQIIRN